MRGGCLPGPCSPRSRPTLPHAPLKPAGRQAPGGGQGGGAGGVGRVDGPGCPCGCARPPPSAARPGPPRRRPKPPVPGGAAQPPQAPPADPPHPGLGVRLDEGPWQGSSPTPRHVLGSAGSEPGRCWGASSAISCRGSAPHCPLWRTAGLRPTGSRAVRPTAGRLQARAGRASGEVCGLGPALRPAGVGTSREQDGCGDCAGHGHPGVGSCRGFREAGWLGVGDQRAPGTTLPACRACRLLGRRGQT